MANKMHPTQIENLLKFSPGDRYDYFIRYCTDFEKVWGLVVGLDNWVIFKDSEGDEVFPLWSHPDLASECCLEEHKIMGATPQSIELESFICNCIPDMDDSNVYFGIFYDKEGAGMAVKAKILEKSLLKEIDNSW